MSTETGHVVIIDTETQAVVADYSSHAMPARSIAWSEDSQVRQILCSDHLYAFR